MSNNVKCVQLKCIACGRGDLLVLAAAVTPNAKVGDTVAWSSACPACEAEGATFKVEALRDVDPNASVAASYASGLTAEAVEKQLAWCRAKAALDGEVLVHEFVDLGTDRAGLRQLVAETGGEAGIDEVYFVGFDRLGDTLPEIRAAVCAIEKTGATLHTMSEDILVYENEYAPVTVRRFPFIETEEAEALTSKCGALAAARLRVDEPKEYALIERQVLAQADDEFAGCFPVRDYSDDSLPVPEGTYVKVIVELSHGFTFIEDLTIHFWWGFREEVAAAAALNRPTNPTRCPSASGLRLLKGR